MRHQAQWAAAALAVAVMMVVGAAAGQGTASQPSAPGSSDYPDAMVFSMMRTLADPVAGVGRADMRDRLRQWQGMAHDHAIRVDSRWLTTDEIATRCKAFIKQHAELTQKINQANADADRLGRQQNSFRMTGGRNGQYILQRQQQDQQLRQEHDRLVQESREKVLAVSRLWPDPLIRWFLQGQAALATNNPAQAEQLFRRCIEEMPTVAAFYQGRAMARAAQKREMDALDDRIAAFNLDATDPETYEELREAFRDAPGNRLTAPAFQRAKALLAEYDAPPARQNRPTAAPRSGQVLIEWLMPGGTWRSDSQSITVPTCHSLIARKTVAVPVSADELVCDEAAIADAAAILLEVGKGQYVRLQPAGVQANELPLAVLRATQCQFKPVEPADAAALKAGQELIAHAYSLPKDLDAATPRKFTLRIKTIEDGVPTFNGGLRPGESAAPLFTADGKLVTFLAGRTDVMADLGGPELTLPPAKVQELIKTAGKGSRGSRSSFSSSSSVTRKAGPWQVDQPVLTLHVIVLQGKP